MEKLKKQILAEVKKRLVGNTAAKSKSGKSIIKSTIIQVFMEKIATRGNDYGIKFGKDPYDFEIYVNSEETEE